ncbi:PBAN-type neuropeptides-like isoform X1 [Trichogramma pretiosum]|uniref:PBAN-type neuropeptides-like isoform X1 n=1 Tax=Trichogramma pretiosum TaxID=7493 RepID=UPI0006C968B3|nr:PBAN-type neuropeptides-like isoform X1 [Trichogramma pretiosum]
MYRVRIRTTTIIASALFMSAIVVDTVSAQYELTTTDSPSGQEAIEGPRVERMHAEASDPCAAGQCLTQNSASQLGGMWFGPRLGRRRRSGGQAEDKLLQLPSSSVSDKKIQQLSEILAAERPSWGIITVPAETEAQSPSLRDGMSKNEYPREPPFTPRLGRELEDRLVGMQLAHSFLERLDNKLDIDDATDGQQQQQDNSQPKFPPRLGRRIPERELRRIFRRFKIYF